MIAMVDRINEKPKFKGKFKNKSFCKWLRFNRKKYVIEGNDDNDSDSDSDWDKGHLINGNKQVQHRYSRQGWLSIFKTVKS